MTADHDFPSIRLPVSGPDAAVWCSLWHSHCLWPESEAGLDPKLPVPLFALRGLPLLSGGSEKSVALELLSTQDVSILLCLCHRIFELEEISQVISPTPDSVQACLPNISWHLVTESYGWEARWGPKGIVVSLCRWSYGSERLEEKWFISMQVEELKLILFLTEFVALTSVPIYPWLNAPKNYPVNHPPIYLFVNHHELTKTLFYPALIIIGKLCSRRKNSHTKEYLFLRQPVFWRLY